MNRTIIFNFGALIILIIFLFGLIVANYYGHYGTTPKSKYTENCCANELANVPTVENPITISPSDNLIWHYGIQNKAQVALINEKDNRKVCRINMCFCQTIENCSSIEIYHDTNQIIKMDVYEPNVGPIYAFDISFKRVAQSNQQSPCILPCTCTIECDGTIFGQKNFTVAVD